jgi:hypothetical protein
VIYFPVLVVLSYMASAYRAMDLPPPPASLTPQEVSEGWILLFDGKSLMGWEARNESKWTLSDGMLAPQGGRPGLLVSTSKFRDCELKVQYIVRTHALFDLPRPNENDPSLMFGCDSNGNLHGKGVSFPLPGAVSPSQIKNRPGTSGWIDLNMTGNESNKGILINHTYGSLGTSSRGLDGHIALDGNGVVFRSIKLRPFKARTLFNGKNLDGWKEAEGVRTRFRVSPEGWLIVRGGPGALQTVDQWQDFVLQLEGRNGVVGLRRPSGPEVRLPGKDRVVLTVAVNGNHLAVWVDGCHTRDENMPEGAKGPVSLLREDADFWNIRLTDLGGEGKNPSKP